jgi:hypothetical protein
VIFVPVIIAGLVVFFDRFAQDGYFLTSYLQAFALEIKMRERNQLLIFWSLFISAIDNNKNCGTKRWMLWMSLPFELHIVALQCSINQPLVN